MTPKSIKDEWAGKVRKNSKSYASERFVYGSLDHGDDVRAFKAGANFGREETLRDVIKTLRDKMEKDGYVPMWCDWLEEKFGVTK